MCKGYCAVVYANKDICLMALALSVCDFVEQLGLSLFMLFRIGSMKSKGIVYQSYVISNIISIIISNIITVTNTNHRKASDSTNKLCFTLRLLRYFIARVNLSETANVWPLLTVC